MWTILTMQLILVAYQLTLKLIDTCLDALVEVVARFLCEELVAIDQQADLCNFRLASLLTIFDDHIGADDPLIDVGKPHDRFFGE